MSYISYRASTRFDDGNDPSADWGTTEQFDRLAEAVRWAKAEIFNHPAPTLGVYGGQIALWYATVERIIVDDDGDYEVDESFWPRYYYPSIPLRLRREADRRQAEADAEAREARKGLVR